MKFSKNVILFTQKFGINKMINIQKNCFNKEFNNYYKKNVIIYFI